VIASLAGLVVGAIVAAGLWTAGSGLLAGPAFERTNYRGARLVTGAGLFVPFSMAIVAGVAETVVMITETNPPWVHLVSVSLLCGVGYGFLGLVDDIAGVGQSGGFRGHVRALAEGRISSGMVKLVGGAALGVVVASSLGRGDEGVVGLLRDGAVVALAANLANLFDRAPGRVIKVTTTLFVVAAVVARSPTLAGPAVGVGAGIGLLRPDLTERSMLGDAGANPLGALCGLAALAAAPAAGARWIILIVLLALNLVSEVVSFTAVIDRIAPLRWLDRLGSQRTSA